MKANIYYLASGNPHVAIGMDIETTPRCGLSNGVEGFTTDPVVVKIKETLEKKEWGSIIVQSIVPLR